MAQYTVQFTQTVSVDITVEVPDELAMPDGVLDVDAIENAALADQPDGLCAQCSGWDRPWSRGGDGELVLNALVRDGEQVWAEE